VSQGDQAEAARRAREALEGATVDAPLGLPTAPPLEVWEELAEEAQRYTELLRAWKAAGPSERKTLDDELLGSLSHLRVHSQVMEDIIEEAMDLADQLEEHNPGASP
jgi:hypothetical protein